VSRRSFQIRFTVVYGLNFDTASEAKDHEPPYCKCSSITSLHVLNWPRPKVLPGDKHAGFSFHQLLKFSGICANGRRAVIAASSSLLGPYLKATTPKPTSPERMR